MLIFDGTAILELDTLLPYTIIIKVAYMNTTYYWRENKNWTFFSFVNNKQHLLSLLIDKWIVCLLLCYFATNKMFNHISTHIEKGTALAKLENVWSLQRNIKSIKRKPYKILIMNIYYLCMLYILALLLFYIDSLTCHHNMTDALSGFSPVKMLCDCQYK